VKSTKLGDIRKVIVAHFNEHKGEWVKPSSIAIALDIGSYTETEYIIQRKAKIILDDMVAKKEIEVESGAVPGDVRFRMS
jgi:hypothetical protein